MATKQSQSFVQQSHLLLTLLRTLAGVRLPEVAVLSEEARTRAARWRRDFEKQAPLLRDLSKSKGLSLAGFALEQMDADLAFADSLEPIRNQVATAFAWLQRALDDTIFSRRSRAWQTFVAHYGMLAKLAEFDPALAAQLKPLVAFFAKGPRVKATEPTG